MSQPRITIITITYNSEKTLTRAIDSIICQEYPNLEYIIVDGGSNDNTVEIIKSYGQQRTNRQNKGFDSLIA